MTWEIKQGQPWPYGVMVCGQNIHLTFELPSEKKETTGAPKEAPHTDRKLQLKIYDLSTPGIEESQCYELNRDWCFGDSCGVSLKCPEGTQATSYGYQILYAGQPAVLPWAKALRYIGAETVYLFQEPDFDWEEDRAPKLDFDDILLYKLHVRGFTKHPSSGVRHRGTFEGVAEKIPHLKALGVNAVELMPVYHCFEDTRQDERKNYWGYGPGEFMAVKPEYAAGPEHAGESLKQLIKALHRENIEVYLEILFTGAESTEYRMECLRHWTLNYHVDGFHVNSATTPLGDVLLDPVLSEIKILSEGFDGTSDRNRIGKRRGIYHNGFQDDMRRFLKGDAGATAGFMERILTRSMEQGYIQYMTNNNGFTMMDLVSYDSRHNEANGENNTDGSSWNFSWNCGAEGVSRKRDVLRLRRQQLKNAWILNIFQQGTPLIYAGDEFGNSQNGNNNAWCQDNEVSWLNWKLLKKNHWLFEFAAEMIELRKQERVLHPQRPYVHMDLSASGLPDVSFHGTTPWFVDTSDENRCIGCMYAQSGSVWYFAYNMGPTEAIFSLPNLPKNGRWDIRLDTAGERTEGTGLTEEKLTLTGHSIAILHSDY